MVKQKAQRRTAAPPRYSAPALEKGLDILEMLADQPDGLTQGELAGRLGRSASEIFRMLAALERRGYIRRAKPEDLYFLTLRLFELAHRHPPAKRLLAAALPVMQSLAGETEQSCHLAVPYNEQVLIVAQLDSPAPLGLSVRLGAQFPMATTASGLVLLAYQQPDAAEREQSEGPPARQADAERLAKQLERIRKRGYEQCASLQTHGITDLSGPVFDHTGTAVAALTVPCLLQPGRRSRLKEVRNQVTLAAGRVSEALGGEAKSQIARILYEQEHLL